MLVCFKDGKARGADLQMDGGDRKAGRDAGGADEDEEMAD